ncbi:response regulator [Pseudopedobacter beijingensis]|uniref:Response regulator n=1 Tax=Pseudopedobacter beijingensis TaxID=1207056 RepID=A0ABW4IA24_9SPHI
MNIRIAIVEDETDTRELLVNLISGYEGYSCVSAYRNAEEALKNLPLIEVDVVLVDIHLPGRSGISLIEQLKASMPRTQFMVCSSLEDSNHIFSALKAGAAGYISKTTTSEKIIQAIYELYHGGSPMSSQIARKVVASFQEQKSVKYESCKDLTKRELEVLDFLSKGYRYKEIGDKLCISVETVRKHINNIYKKLQVNSAIEAINLMKG